MVSSMHLAAGVPRVFPPIVATHVVKLACELPDDVGRSLSTWTCAELARTLKTSGIVETISPQSVQRILSSHKLKPWRVHHWLSTVDGHENPGRFDGRAPGPAPDPGI